MKVFDCEQGTREWEMLRVGIPTASNADRLITPSKLNPSAQRFKYRNEILSEWLIGRPVDFSGSTPFMERGREMEPEARKFYQFQRDVEVETVGFVTRDDERFGGSPDGLVGDSGIIEIKVPALHNHISFLLGEEHSHRGQIMGYLALTDREWCDLISYHPELPPVIERVERDEEYIAAFDEVLEEFLEDLDRAKERLAEYRDLDVQYTGADDEPEAREADGSEAPATSERDKLYARWCSVWDEHCRIDSDTGDDERIGFELDRHGKRATEWTVEQLRRAIEEVAPVVTA